jgi:hypothetical protein
MTLGRSFVRLLPGVALLAACDVTASGGSVPISSPGPAGEQGAPLTLVRDGDGSVRVQATDARRAALADVSLPPRADLPARVRDRATGLEASISLVGASAAPPEIDGLAVTYRGAGPSGGDVLQRPSTTGTEDYVRFPEKPEREEIRYLLRAGGAAGLRLVANVLELVDASGTPRLRMGSPYVVDAGGVRRAASVALPDCAADTSPAGPWGRPVTPPGRAECTVRVSWGGGGTPLEYPVLVDPSWKATTNTMAAARKAHTATLLANGKVLIVGGESTTASTTVHEKTAELFDPKTSTFSPTGSLTVGRSFHVAVLMDGGNVLVAGGDGDAAPLFTSELYDVTKGTFRTVGALHEARTKAQAVLLTTKEVLVAGGIDGKSVVLDSAELFDPTGEQWSTTDTMESKRTGYYLTTLPTGAALAVAGITTTSIGDLASCQLYQPATHTWSATAGLAEARYDFGGTTFSDGRVLVASGYSRGISAATAKAELFDPSGGTWSAAGSLKVARMHHTLTALPNGSAVAAGGVVTSDGTTVTSRLKSAELYDASTNAWSALPDMSEPRSFHTATLLGDGRVLVAGGDGAAGALDTAELFQLDANGAACKAAATCDSGFCVDGVCCASACTTSCNACDAASTGKASGTCAPVLAGKDPRNDCKDDGAPACKNDGLCDGAGGCEKYPASPCTPKACTADADCASGACADGVCCDSACSGACEACTAAKKGSGKDGTCGPVAKGADPDAECGTMGTGTCRGDATCDGARSCRVPNAGKSCAPAACSNTVTLAAAAQCGATGDCTPTTTDCTPYTCDPKQVACRTTCTTDAQCATGAHCNAGACEKSAAGAACKTAAECTSGFCADGVCCDAACDGQCEACDLTGTEGTCTPVAGPPHGSRAACAGADPCAGTCNGLLTTACAYPGADTSCGASASCTDGSETGDRCNGSGDCVASPVKACAPFTCGTDACKTTCKTDADCITGYRCDASKACVSTLGGSCSTGDTLTEPDGGKKSCSPYLCAAGECTTSCKKDSECASPATCQGEHCVAPSDGGCGCRVATERGAGSRSALGLLVTAIALWRRRPARKPPTGRRHAKDERNAS